MAKKKRVTPTTAMIWLDADLVEQSSARLNERGLDLEEYVALMLRMMLRSKAVINLTDRMPFGKYAGELVDLVARSDPAYLIWLTNNSRGSTTFAPEVHTLVMSMAENKQ